MYPSSGNQSPSVVAATMCGYFVEDLPGVHLTRKSPGTGGSFIQMYPSPGNQRPSVVAATMCGYFVEDLPGVHLMRRSPDCLDAGAVNRQQLAPEKIKTPA